MNASWLETLIERLEACGPVGQSTREYLRQRNVTLGVRPQPTGARWTMFSHIDLRPDFATGKDDAYALSLIVHEVQHLRQGWLTALSVYGELKAWQMQFEFLKSLTGKYSASSKNEEIITELIALSITNRADLKRARGLMQAFAGKKYRIDLLPSYPIGREIWFWLTGKTEYLSA